MPSLYSTSRDQFEQRMRARRAATCLAIARTAVASGRVGEAIERLEEACALDPDEAEARLLLEELRLQPPVATGEDEERVPARAGRGDLRGWSHWMAAGVAIGVLAGLAIFSPSNPQEAERVPAPPTQQVPDDGDSDEGRPGVIEEVPPAAVVARSQEGAVGTTGRPDVAEAEGETAAPTAGQGALGGTERVRPVVTQALPMVERGMTAGEDRPAAVTTFPGRVTAESPSAPSASVPPPVSVPANAEASRPPVTSSPTSSGAMPPVERVAIATEEPRLPVEPVAPPRAETALRAEAREAAPSEVGAVEDTLHRYADAYTRLDAGAARRVWPGVDERALARAFQALESQGLVFEHCDLDVAENDATAACRGRARYVPKVGSREPRIERRQWRFRLHKSEAGWQIVQAEAR